MWSIRENIPTALFQESQRHHSENSSPPSLGTVAPTIWLNKLYKYDISLDVSKVPTFMGRLIRAIQRYGYEVQYPEHSYPLPEDGSASPELDPTEVVRSDVFQQCSSPITLNVCTFGHLGDSNIHINILLAPQSVQMEKEEIAIVAVSEVASKSWEEGWTKRIVGMIQKDLDHVVYSLTVEYDGMIAVFADYVVYLILFCYVRVHIRRARDRPGQARSVSEDQIST